MDTRQIRKPIARHALMVPHPEDFFTAIVGNSVWGVSVIAQTS
jgi:hypothetical protein